MILKAFFTRHAERESTAPAASERFDHLAGELQTGYPAGMADTADVILQRTVRRHASATCEPHFAGASAARVASVTTIPSARPAVVRSTGAVDSDG